MRLPRLLCALTLAVLAFVASSSRAHADTYQVFNLASDNGGYLFAGMSDTGLVVIKLANTPGCGGTDCYFSFLDGASTGPASGTAPFFTADDGSPCSPSTPAGFILIGGICNNGRYAYKGFASSAISHPSLYDDLDNAIGDGSGSFLFMNSLGDIVWNDPTREFWVEAVDLTSRTTPEPSSLLLLATGSLGIAGFAMRRRLAS